MKKRTKLLSIALSFALVSSCLPSMVSANEPTYLQATDGYFWLEAEDSTSIDVGYNYNLQNAMFSGGVAKGVYQSSVPSTGYYVDFFIDVEKTAEYDIYNYGGKVGHSWASTGKIRIDDEPIANQPTAITGETWYSGAMNMPCAWNKTTVEIPAGEHKLTYYIDTPVSANGATYGAGLDVICVVPTSYAYTPTGNGATTAKPVKPEEPEIEYTPANEDGYYWLEGEESTSKHERFAYQMTNAGFSGEKAIGLSESTLPDTGYYVDFFIDVEEEKEYDIFTYASNVSNTWMSAGKIRIDDEPIANQPTHLLGDAWINSGGINIPFGWNKTTVTIPAGEHKFTYYVDSSRASGTTGYISGLDVICVVPTAYGYTPSGNGATAAKPVKPAEPEIEYTPANEDGYYWLEAEESTSKHERFAYQMTNAGFSGEKAIGLSESTLPDTGYYVDFFIDVEEEKEYDIFAYAANVSNSWMSPGKIRIDGTPVENQLAHFLGEAWSGGALSVPFGWNKTTVTIPEGNHKLTYYIDSSRASGTTAYITGIDAICVVPASYEYAPSGNGATATKPVKPKEVAAQKYAWLEETDRVAGGTGMDPIGEHADKDTTELSGDDALRVSSSNGAAGFYNIEYSYKAEKAGEYDIYYRASGNNTWMSPNVITVDGTAYPATFVKEDGWIFGMWNVTWHKATVTLTGDVQKIKWEITDALSNGNWVGLFDAMCIVPKGTPLSIGANPDAVKADMKLAVLLADYDLSNVTENLVLPQTTADGEAVTWSSSNGAVVSDAGVITRSEVADVTVTLTATCGEYAKTFNVTVKAEREFDVANFSKRGIIAPGNTLAATANVKYNKGEEKNVILMIALYSKDGKIIEVNLDKKAANAQGVDLNTEIEIPADYQGDLTGAYTKAFLWNDVDDLKPIVEAL